VFACAGFTFCGLMSAAEMPGNMTGPASVTVTSRRHDPAIVKERRTNNATSTNWSGYAVTGPNGSVTDVKGSWIVPSIQGTCPKTNQYSSFWVGIDGFGSNTVEQTGTDSDCVGGTPTYYAWFEFYPHPSFTINTVTVHPGDTIEAEVAGDGTGTFSVTLTNKTTGATFSTSTKVRSAQQASAEWVVEAPYSGGILPLADFGSASFGQDYTAVRSTSTATVGGVTGSIGSFAGKVAITMETSGGVIKAQPSSLTTDGTSFTDSWRNAGP
jgi:hypothetical protein